MGPPLQSLNKEEQIKVVSSVGAQRQVSKGQSSSPDEQICSADKLLKSPSIWSRSSVGITWTCRGLFDLFMVWCLQPQHTDRLHRDTGRTHGGSAATAAATSGWEVFGEEFLTMQQHKYNVTVVNGGSDGMETAILEVWVKHASSRLIKSVVESSLVKTQGDQLWQLSNISSRGRPTCFIAGSPADNTQPQVIGRVQAAPLPDIMSICERDRNRAYTSLLFVDQLDGSAALSCARLWLAAIPTQGSHHFSRKWMGITSHAFNFSLIASTAP